MAACRYAGLAALPFGDSMAIDWEAVKEKYGGGSSRKQVNRIICAELPGGEAMVAAGRMANRMQSFGDGAELAALARDLGKARTELAAGGFSELAAEVNKARGLAARFVQVRGTDAAPEVRKELKKLLNGLLDEAGDLVLAPYEVSE